MRQQLSDAQWATVSAKFDALVGATIAERDRQLASPCDPIIAQNVRSLLDAVAGDGILDGATPVLSSDTSSPFYRSLGEGTLIGAFEIDALIGRGGMGEVYSARRAGAEFEQRVALKVLRPEAVSQTDLFDRERRLLARLDHPGIARLIDGGMTPDGRPYMAMEYVDGEPIDAWCRSRRASLATRLKLICDVCAAVSYAHGNLIVHRDLKPSNILVDTDGRARLLDFGIAKIIDENASMATTIALMTPDYAAPEQLGDATPTVATDVYALGAVMFELLAGRGAWRTEGASLPSIIRRVLADDPPLPSTLVAAHDLPFASSAVAGDLDAIVMKAMRRKPAERYASVAALADDIDRYLDVKPVAARGGSTSYAFGRFVRRHRVAVGAATAAFLAILVGAGGIAWQARQTAIERDIAISEVRRSESIVRMLTVMFRDTAGSAAGENATVKQMLDQTAKNLVARVDTSAKSATLIITLFDLYLNLEDAAGADALIKEALAKGIGKSDRAATAMMKMRAASAAAALGRTEEMGPLLDAAEPVFRADPERFRTELVEFALARAQQLRRTGKIDEAITLLSSSLDEADMAYGQRTRDLLTHYNNLLAYMAEASRFADMPPVFARADAILARTGEQNSMPGFAIGQLKGVRLLRLEQYARAETALSAVAAQRRAVFGQSMGLAVDLYQVSRAKIARGKYAEAKALLSESWPMAEKYLSPTAPPTLVIGLTFADAAAETGDIVAAKAALAKVAPTIDAAKKPAQMNALLARARALILLKEGKSEKARAPLAEAEAIFKTLGPGGASYLPSITTLRARIDKAAATRG